MNSLLFIFGFFLFLFPGILGSVMLRSRVKGVSTLIISGNLLFQCCFWMNFIGIKINTINLLVCFAIISSILLYFTKKEIKNFNFKSSLGIKIPSIAWCFIAPVLLIVLLFTARSLLQAPLPGDITFRWNFLAQMILQHGNFNFYPPLTPDDYGIYFYTDGIPPMVSFINTWFLAFANGNLFGIQVFVILQFVVCLILCFRITQNFANSKLAPYFATAILAGTPLFFHAIYIGQESGLLTISLVAVIFFLSTSGKKDDSRTAILLASAAAIGALSREYGLSFFLLALAISFFQKWNISNIILLSLVFLLLVSPWYLRTWILTGNPFYSIDVAGLFKVNAVHNGIMQYYNSQAGWSSSQSSTMFKEFLFNLFIYAGPALILCIPSFFISPKCLKMLLPGIALIFVLWFYSVGYTPGGIFHSMRVFAPACCLLSVGCGMIFTLKKEFLWVGTAAIITICGLGLWMQITIPYPVWKSPISRYKNIAFHAPYNTMNQIFQFQALLPCGAKVISDNSHFHAALANSNEKKVFLIPPWSPELEFLVDKSLTFDEASIILKEKGINYLIIPKKSLNISYLGRFPFYKEISLKCTPIAVDRFDILYKLP